MVVPSLPEQTRHPGTTPVRTREEMGFRMLIGREALVQGFVVDSRLSYEGPRPVRSTRRKNWGTS